MKLNLLSLTRLSGALIACCTLAGCGETVRHLKEPDSVPVFVSSYIGPELHARAGDVSCTVNLVNCPEFAQVTVSTFSGTTEVGPTFPARTILAGEFAAVAQANFRTQFSGNQSQIEIGFTPQTMRFMRKGDTLTFQLSLQLRLQAPHGDGRPLFEKRYDCETHGVVYDERTVSPCVYEAVQRVAAEFVKDLNGDSALIAKIGALTP